MFPHGFFLERAGGFLVETFDITGGYRGTEYVGTDTPGGGRFLISMGCISVKTNFSLGGGFGRVRYQTGRPKFKPNKLRVSIMGVLTMLEGKKKRAIY